MLQECHVCVTTLSFQHDVMFSRLIKQKETVAYSYKRTYTHPRRPRGSQSGREKRRDRKFSSTGKRAPGYRLSQNDFKKFKQMPPPDWAQKMLIVLLCPIGEQFLQSSFREFVHDGYCLDHGLSGSCANEMHAVSKLSV